MELPKKLAVEIDGDRVSLVDDHHDYPQEVVSFPRCRYSISQKKYDREAFARELALAWNAWMHFSEQDTAYAAARERALAEEAEDAAEGRL